MRAEEKLGQEEIKELDKKSEELEPDSEENVEAQEVAEKVPSTTLENTEEIPGQMELTKDMPEYCPDEVILNEPEPDDTEPGQQDKTDQEEIASHYGSRKKYLDSLTEYRAALYMAASIREMSHMLLNDPDYWNQWLSQEVDDHGEAIELVE